MRWFISDPHFFHKHVIRYNKRPFNDNNEMHETLIRNWNKKINNKDVVYIIGDFSFGNFYETCQIVKRLNGKKRLIRGNHDYRFTSKDFVDMGFEDVRDHLLISINGFEVLLSHFPYHKPFKAFWYNKILKRHYKKYYDFYPRYCGRWLIHGHFHHDEKVKPKNKEINVCVDNNEYSPVSELTILNYLKEYA